MAPHQVRSAGSAKVSCPVCGQLFEGRSDQDVQAQLGEHTARHR